ncbi:DNA polymerase III subunit gamma/tau [Metamycoplasma equirhinis]|uniref:DNA polymerase III subunit gamma/tau n=1 Tax=Metamycoplasma equirhinis TaxID=92402 RepID=UPI003593CFE0
MSLSDKYLALYRQYRPSRFDEVKGQDHIIKTLKNIILNEKISHAYLFCGPHGNGKTSTAKIFANTINCLHNIGNKLEPCEDCIRNVDRNIDIIEIDAASNTGIDDIRELREKVKHLPTNSKYKIYIIDEVHMLSKGAFNALLKTLEEPPTHVIFILATTDPQKIPLTILSRVQRFNFKKMSKNILIENLDFIFHKENIRCDYDALELLSQLGAGSFRDTLSLADQVSIYCGHDTITTNAIKSLFGITDINNIIKLLNLADSKNISELLGLTNLLFESGIDFERMLNQLIDALRDFIIFKKTNDSLLLESLNIENVQNINLSEKNAEQFIECILKTIKDIKYSDFTKQLIELMWIKLINIASENEPTQKYQNIIESPSTIADEKDFQIASQINNFEHEIKNEKQNRNQNAEFNSYFNLSNIANNYDFSPKKSESEDIEVEEINVDDILEKTSEILLSETTAEFELESVEDQIISSEYNTSENNEILPSYPNTKNNSNEEITNFPKKDNKLISIEQIVDCLLIRQFAKNNLKNYENSDFTIKDSVQYGILDQKLFGTETSIQTKNILRGFKILFSSTDFVLFTCNIDEKVFDLNINAYKDEVINASFKVFDRYVHLFAITNEQINEVKKYWQEHINELRQKTEVKKLPDISKLNSNEKEKIKWAQDIFGDKFKITK